MKENFPKYIIGFLGLIYLGSCFSEAWLVKGGVEAVFESVKTFVPHMTMFIVGYYFSRRD